MDQEGAKLGKAMPYYDLPINVFSTVRIGHPSETMSILVASIKFFALQLYLSQQF